MIPIPQPKVSGASVRRFRAEHYNLEATLESGQAFRWHPIDGGWEGVIGNQWVRLRQTPGLIEATTSPPVSSWPWLEDYLQIHVHLGPILDSFPNDPELEKAVASCHGLRLLRQQPWECLASFILSSTKQIAQIRQIVASLCARFGTPIPTPLSTQCWHTFPTPQQLAACSEPQLRNCKMGFRAPYLLNAARRVASGSLDLNQLASLHPSQARLELESLQGVGRKIADCVLLFACGFQNVFPVDVWVQRALRAFYFPRKRPSPSQLRSFSETHFAPHGGYAQQYLFHYIRTKRESPPSTHEPRRSPHSPGDRHPAAQRPLGNPLRGVRYSPGHQLDRRRPR